MGARKILIVDPFSTGALYAPALQEKGFKCFGIRSHEASPHFIASYTGDGLCNSQLMSIEEAKSKFSKDNLASVVAGSEVGVKASEKLAFYFEKRGNDPRTTNLRRNKYFMQESLRECGLKNIRTTVISDGYINIPNFEKYVLKPVSSALTEGVFFCDTREDVEQYIQQIEWGSVNILGEEQYEYLLQEYVAGQEYVVDLIVDGESVFVSSVCRYVKGRHNGSGFVYESLELCDPCDARYSEIINYSKKAVKALDISFGPVHMEIIDSNDGPVMIEAGARLHGGIAPKLFEYCYYPNLLGVSVDLYSGSSLIDGKSELRNLGKIVFLYNEKEGVVIYDVAGLKEDISSLPSCLGVKILSEENVNVVLTRDLSECPGIVWLSNVSEAQLEADELEARKIFNYWLKEKGV